MFCARHGWPSTACSCRAIERVAQARMQIGASVEDDRKRDCSVVRVIDLADSLELGVHQDWLVQLEHPGVLGRLDQAVPLCAERAYERHDAVFSCRVDRGIRDLRKDPA